MVSCYRVYDSKTECDDHIALTQKWNILFKYLASLIVHFSACMPYMPYQVHIFIHIYIYYVLLHYTNTIRTTQAGWSPSWSSDV